MKLNFKFLFLFPLFVFLFAIFLFKRSGVTNFFSYLDKVFADAVVENMSTSYRDPGGSSSQGAADGAGGGSS